MEFKELEISGVYLLCPKIFRDDRGFFSETWNQAHLKKLGIEAHFVQDNHSLSRPQGTVRGLHFQDPPMTQGKLVRVTRGAVLDVVVDIRNNSPTFGKHVAVELSAENWHQLWVPEGMAHGFCTLEPDTEFLYKVTNYYSAEHERGILWNDPALEIDWPVEKENAILSEKDKQMSKLTDIRSLFTYKA